MANEYEVLKYPVFATKAAILTYIRNNCPNSPAITDLLYRLANTNLGTTGAVSGLTDGTTILRTSFGL